MSKSLRKVFCLILALVLGIVSVPQVMAYEYDSQPDKAVYSAEKYDVSPLDDSYDAAPQGFPFSFNLISFDENSVIISFNSTSEVQSLTIEQYESKNVIAVSDNSKITLLIGENYSFEVIYQEKDCSVVYNGHLTPVLSVLGSDEQVILKTRNVVKNIIKENTLKSYDAIHSLAAGTLYESESNNTYSTADRTYDDYDNYGALSSTSDVDWWVVSFSSAGEANFWLGNIPSGCDYELTLYASNGTTLLASSRNGSNTAELITYSVSANTKYYACIYSYSGSSSSQYLFSAKNYPTSTGDSFEPNNTQSTASAIALGSTITTANLHASTDIDFFKFTLSSGSNVNIELSNIPSGCDYDLQLLNNSGTVLASSAKGSNKDESISISISSGTYYIKVYSFSGSSNTNYSLKLSPAGSTNITIQKIETIIPQNISAVSRNLPSSESNACYDYNSSFKPYSGWVSIDYTNSSGKVGTLPDRVLRQMKIIVTVKNGTTPVPGATVSISTSLGDNAYIYTPSTTTNSDGQLTTYIEFYSNRTFTVSATYNGTTQNQSVSSGNAVYKNKFYLSLYNFPKRSNFSSWEAFEAAVQLNGTGYDDINNQWYKYNSNGSIIPVSGPNNTSSGTTPTEYRTIAVDSPYVTRRSYVSDGSSSAVYHRGRVIIEGLNNVSGDSGYRTAEDAGSAINGYHIDLFIGFRTVSQFANEYSSYIPKSSGYYFPQVTYSSTLKGSV